MNAPFIYSLFPHQIKAHDTTLKALRETGGGILQIPCGQGKCHSRGTQILMFDGTIKKVEDIVVGDQLMGDDSTPRNVLSLARGRDEMYEIQPVKGNPWGCNKAHILSLKCSTNWSHRFTKGSIHDIELSDFLNYPKSFHGRGTPLKLYKVSITFPTKNVDLDPYMLGYWLGDWKSGGAQITTTNPEVLTYFTEVLETYGLILKQVPSDKITYRIVQAICQTGVVRQWSCEYGANFFLYCLKNYDLINNKHIPMEYKCNSRDVQLKVLAGLIDSDGYQGDNMYQITLVNEHLLDDIVFMCRSLGFATYKSTVQKTCTNSASSRAVREHPDDKYGCVTGTYYQCSISGKGLEEIPVLLAYKKASPRKQIKDALVVGFAVKSIGVGDYYGFEIDGNHRYLLGDFTVTHNTAVAIKIATELQFKTLVVVNKECLMDQWADSIAKFTGGKARIGYIQQDKVAVADKDFVIAMLHSVSQKDYPDELFQDFGFSIVDECHHIASDMFSRALPKITSQYMLGLSATPNRKDGLSHVFHEYLGNVCHSERRSGTNQMCIKRIKLSSQSPLYETLYMKNGIKNNVGMITNLSKHPIRNQLIIEMIRILMRQDRKILLLSGRREHLETIYHLLESAHIMTIHNKPLTFGYYYGNQGGNKKQHKQLLQESAKCDVVLGTLALSSEGLDIPDLNTEILTTPATEVEQSVGRILRKFHDRVNPMVIDLIDDCGNFSRQATVRKKFYQSEEYDVQDWKIPLGDEVRDLQPFLSDLSEFILTPADIKKSARIAGNGTNDDDDDDDESETDRRHKTVKLGKCLLTDTPMGPTPITSTSFKLAPSAPLIQPKLLISASSTAPKPKPKNCLL